MIEKKIQKIKEDFLHNIELIKEKSKDKDYTRDEIMIDLNIVQADAIIRLLKCLGVIQAEKEPSEDE